MLREYRFTVKATADDASPSGFVSSRRRRRFRFERVWNLEGLESKSSSLLGLVPSVMMENDVSIDDVIRPL